MSGNAVTVDTSTGAVPKHSGRRRYVATPIQSGALAGYAELRDTIAPQYQAQLDQIAGGLINAFAESDQPGADTPTAPGLFTT